MTLALISMLSVLASNPTSFLDDEEDAAYREATLRSERRALADARLGEAKAAKDSRALRTYQRTHSEMSVGYLGQWSDERNRGFALRSSTGPAELAGAVVDPFLGAPFVGAVQAGPTIEWRGVLDGVRFTTGVRFPFTSFRPSDSAQRVTLNGAEHDVLVRSVSVWEFRTGLGFELPFHRVAPFVDVLGDVSTLNAQLAIDGHAADYRSTAFSLGGRVGLRVQVSHVFIQAAAEAMAIGPVRLGGSLQAGVAF